MLSKFADTTMPKGKGRKGGKHSRKCKPQLAIETRVQNPSLQQQVTPYNNNPQAVTTSQSVQISNSATYNV